jgi:hypothetical protein
MIYEILKFQLLDTPDISSVQCLGSPLVAVGLAFLVLGVA